MVLIPSLDICTVGIALSADKKEASNSFSKRATTTACYLRSTASDFAMGLKA